MQYKSVMTLWEESDSEDDLPPEWQELVETDGRVVYRNPTTGWLHCTHPITGRSKRVADTLPTGWFCSSDESGRMIFINSNAGRISYTDPRLPSAILTASLDPVRVKFDKFSTADEILPKSNLKGKFVIVTSSGCGLGHLLATKLVSYGAVVICACAYRPSNAAPLTGPLSEIPSNSGLFWIRCDLNRLDSVVHFAKVYEELMLPLYACVLASDFFPVAVSHKSRVFLSSLAKKWTSLIDCAFNFISKYAWSGFPDSCECLRAHTISGGLTEDGNEVAMQRNVLAQFLLIESLHPVFHRMCLQMGTNSDRPRIILLSGESHRIASGTHATSSSSLSIHTYNLIDRLEQYSVSKFYQLACLYALQYQIQHWSNRTADLNCVPLICACNCEHLLIPRCTGVWWICLRNLWSDCALTVLRLLIQPFRIFLPSALQTIASACLCLSDTTPIIHYGREKHVAYFVGCRQVKPHVTCKDANRIWSIVRSALSPHIADSWCSPDVPYM